MELSDLTDQKFIAGLHAALQERGPDWVYPEEWRDEHGRCRYINGGQPACLIGMALMKAGISAETLFPFEGEGPDQIMEDVDGRVSELVIEAACEAQTAQDGRKPWSVAVQEFHDFLTRHNYQPQEW